MRHVNCVYFGLSKRGIGIIDALVKCSLFFSRNSIDAAGWFRIYYVCWLKTYECEIGYGACAGNKV